MHQRQFCLCKQNVPIEKAENERWLLLAHSSSLAPVQSKLKALTSDSTRVDNSSFNHDNTARCITLCSPGRCITMSRYPSTATFIIVIPAWAPALSGLEVDESYVHYTFLIIRLSSDCILDHRSLPASRSTPLMKFNPDETPLFFSLESHLVVNSLLRRKGFKVHFSSWPTRYITLPLPVPLARLGNGISSDAPSFYTSDFRSMQSWVPRAT